MQRHKGPAPRRLLLALPVCFPPSRKRCHPGIGTPPSACRRIAMICASVYLLVFIRNLLDHLAEKILLTQPLTFGGITPGQDKPA
jgi:hypothetical protein